MKRLPVLLLTVLMAFACSKELPAPVNSQAAADDDSTPQEGGTLVRRLPSDINTLNPVLATSRYDHYLINYLYTPLVYLDVNLQCVPGLAEKWDISPDGKTYTFHLNPAATFEDHTPVLASDVLYTLGKIVDPRSEAAEIAGLFDQLDLAHSRVIDPHTVQLQFREALAPQLSRFNYVNVVPEHAYSQGNFATDFTSKAVGNGPYKLVRREPGKEILLQRREDYWRRKPYIKTILFKVIVDDVTGWNAVKHGDVDETIIGSDTWHAESGSPDLQKQIDFRRFYYLAYNYIAWNAKDPVLSDKRVRHALAMCLDLKSIINNLYYGTARAMNGPFTPDQWAYNPNVPVIRYDPAGAQKLLTSIGWLDTDGDGILDRDHKPLKFDMLVFAGSQAALPLAQVYQAELKKIGVQMNIVTLEPAVYFQRLLAGNYEAAHLSWDLDPDPDPYAMFHSSQTPPHGQNFVYYQNPVADKLMEEGRTTIDQGKRVPIYQQLHALLADDQPYTWTLQVSTKWAINRRVRGVAESKGFGLFLWYPGELDWWIPKSKRTHDTPAPAR